MEKTREELLEGLIENLQKVIIELKKRNFELVDTNKRLTDKVIELEEQNRKAIEIIDACKQMIDDLIEKESKGKV